MRVNRILHPGLALAFLSGCEVFTGADDAGWVHATIQEGVEVVQYEGTGSFHVGPGHDVPIQFQLSSRVAGPEKQRLLFDRPGAGRPAKGTYAIGPLEVRNGARSGLIAFYSRTIDGIRNSYVALSGELEITRSSDNRIEDTFTIAGALYCSAPIIQDMTGIVEWDCSADTVDDSAPRIEITGSFMVVPLKFTGGGPD